VSITPFRIGLNHGYRTVDPLKLNE
jgi:hypothetical protein